jgi:hypothetical protein
MKNRGPIKIGGSTQIKNGGSDLEATARVALKFARHYDMINLTSFFLPKMSLSPTYSPSHPLSVVRTDFFFPSIGPTCNNLVNSEAFLPIVVCLSDPSHSPSLPLPVLGDAGDHLMTSICRSRIIDLHIEPSLSPTGFRPRALVHMAWAHIATQEKNFSA